MTQKIRTGLDRIVSGAVKLPKASYGLLTAGHARTWDGQAARLVLQKKIDLVRLFSPEHGLDGVAGAGEKVSSTEDRLTGLPVTSLYQGQQDALDAQEILHDVDAMIYDLPDVGVRFYTYISSCLQMVDLCAEAGIPMFILDRPNPLGGTTLEGPVLEEADQSFVGIYTLPIRYGLTIGELATLYIDEQEIDIDLTVVRCEGWQRDQLFNETQQIYTIPSPNLPTFESCLVYPGTCLFEGTKLSEGRGTPRPFTWFGAPWIDRAELFAFAQSLDKPGFTVRPQSYVPSSSKNEGKVCHGLTLEITDPREVRTVPFICQILNHLHETYEAFELLDPFQENGVSFMGRLLGKKAANLKNWPLKTDWREEQDDFRKRTEGYLLYD